MTTLSALRTVALRHIYLIIHWSSNTLFDNIVLSWEPNCSTSATWAQVHQMLTFPFPCCPPQPYHAAYWDTKRAISDDEPCRRRPHIIPVARLHRGPRRNYVGSAVFESGERTTYVQGDPSAWALYSVAINLGSSPGLLGLQLVASRGNSPNWFQQN